MDSSDSAGMASTGRNTGETDPLTEYQEAGRNQQREHRGKGQAARNGITDTRSTTGRRARQPSRAQTNRRSRPTPSALIPTRL